MSKNPADYIQIAGELFERVQSEGIFPDSKHFVDMVPRREPAEILAAYDAACDLKEFVEENFFLPEKEVGEAPKCESLHEYLLEMWQFLTREMKGEKWGTLIDLPHAHVVPGGRFRECYYWDTYFVAKALGKAGENLVENCAHMIDLFGFVPNGNRLYYLSRSQPPLFAMMTDLCEKDFSDQLLREYHFWMRGVELEDQVHQHVVKTDAGVLNRYFDPAEIPRPESHEQDLPYTGKYGDIRAACESGWDFSSRWLADPKNFGSIETSKILPVDLNCFLYYLETKVDAKAAEKRKKAIETAFWDGEFFVDVHFETMESTGRKSLAGVMPLYFQIASKSQAKKVSEKIEGEFLRPGGLLTTLCESGQQWDAPNGWAPLHYFAVHGLKKYGFENLADEIARRWKENCIEVFHKEGTLFEKYNVEEIGKIENRGEYVNQEGFGWTNATMTLL